MSSSTLRSVDGARRPGGPIGATGTLLICVIVAVGAFEAMWFGVVTDTGLAVADPALVGWIVAHRGPGLVGAARLVSDVGAPAVSVTVAVVAVGWSAWRSRWRAAAFGMVGIGALVTVDVGMKAAVARARPPVAWHAVSVQGYAFPSGHALLSAGVVMLLGWLVHRHDLLPFRGGTGVALGGLAGCFLGAVGASRVVLAVHFPSDVLAGWFLAVFVVAAVGFVDVAWMRRGAE
jgi:membrane-associated phospholipid phosphatase